MKRLLKAANTRETRKCLLVGSVLVASSCLTHVGTESVEEFPQSRILVFR